MPTSKTRLAHYMPYRMAITSDAVSSHIASDYGERFDLKIPEWRVMAVLGEMGALTQRDLCRATQMDKVAVNRACRALDDRGYLFRNPNASDGRSHHLELTESGRDLYEQIWPQAYAAYERIYSALTPREVERLRELLDKLLNAVRQIDAAPARASRYVMPAVREQGFGIRE
jgi:DNA-binding MarR family transcriptional regulator